MVKEFMKLYEDHEGFETMEKMIESLNYQNLVNQTSIEYLKSLGINDRFSNEVLQSGTRGNYCQDLNRLHPFALMVFSSLSLLSYLMKLSYYVGINGSWTWYMGCGVWQFPNF